MAGCSEDHPGRDHARDHLTMGIKKRILVGAAVGTTVFGSVFGLAVGLDVTSGDKLGSGQANVTSCDLDGVTTSYVFDGATNVTAIQVDGIADNCDDATVSVAASNSPYENTSSYSSSYGSMVSGSAVLTTYVNGYNDFDYENNSIVVPLDTPMNAALFDTVIVTLHGGHPPVLTPG
jgi:hypothetical protein